MDTLIYETPAYKIGKTRWKLIVYEQDDALLPHNSGVWTIGIKRFTSYLWLCGESQWRSETEHPRYNSHDGTWAGLPQGLRKIYERHRSDIEQALEVQSIRIQHSKPLQSNMFQSAEDMPLFSNSPVKVATESYKPCFVQYQYNLPIIERRP